MGRVGRPGRGHLWLGGSFQASCPLLHTWRVGPSAGSPHSFLRNEDFLAAREMEIVSESIWDLTEAQETRETLGGGSSSQARSPNQCHAEPGGPRGPGNCQGEMVSSGGQQAAQPGQGALSG